MEATVLWINSGLHSVSVFIFGFDFFQSTENWIGKLHYPPCHSNYMPQGPCSSKGHNRVMKAIAKLIFFFFFPQINFFTYHPGELQPPSHCILHSSILSCDFCFLPSNHLSSLLDNDCMPLDSALLLMSFIVNIRLKKTDTGTPLKTACHPHPPLSSLSVLQKSQTSEPVKKKTVSPALSPRFSCSSVLVMGHKDWTDLTLSNQAVTLYHLQLTALSSHK